MSSKEATEANDLTGTESVSLTGSLLLEYLSVIGRRDNFQLILIFNGHRMHENSDCSVSVLLFIALAGHLSARIAANIQSKQIHD